MEKTVEEALLSHISTTQSKQQREITQQLLERGYHKHIAATNTDHASKMKETSKIAKQIAQQN